PVNKCVPSDFIYGESQAGNFSNICRHSISLKIEATSSQLPFGKKKSDSLLQDITVTKTKLKIIILFKSSMSYTSFNIIYTVTKFKRCWRYRRLLLFKDTDCKSARSGSKTVL